MASRIPGAAAAILTLAPVSAISAPPTLPTPCFAASCGSNAQSFVQYGAAGAAFSGATLTVTQTTSKAILNWADFNIASGNTVKFVQPSATASVLNNIWSADPSVIAGKLTANGQVYLYNQNGILFANGAQINTGGLVAASLALPNQLFENGILSGNSPLVPPPAVFVAPPNGAPGPITVNPGAVLTTTDGGRIMLIGSAVVNQGQITTPDGQTILAAATNNVYLAASSDPSMRGLLIAVDGGGTTGTVTNSGAISAPRGNVTLAGLIVNQQGMISATTSVGANGSIYLVAGDTDATLPYYNANPQQSGGPTAFGGLLPNHGGTLTLAPGSVTQIQPDSTDTGTLTVPQQAAFVPSQVDLAGQTVTLSGNAAIKAPGGRVNVYGAADPYALITEPTMPIADNGSIYLDSKSSIDVSGLSQVQVPATVNVLEVTLETNDLQNAPLLRNGFLHGATVTVDVNNPPSLFDVTPYANNIGSNIDQVLTKAGTIQLNATGQVVTRAGSELNVSGGSIAYQSAYGAPTTNLIGADGKIYNISTAPNTVDYVGIANSYSYTDQTWGTTNQVSGQVLYPGYLQGANAGTLAIESPVVYLRGTMLGNTVTGAYQRSPSSLALGATFDLGCASCVTAAKVPNFGVNGGVTFTNDIQDSLSGGGASVPESDLPVVSLISPAQLVQNGFNAINVYTNGPVALPAGIAVPLAPNGSLTIKSGSSIDDSGSITGPGVSVALQTANTSDGKLHDITIEPGAIIDVSGAWINDSPTLTPQLATAPTAINGGNVALSAAGDVSLAANTSINVSGGGWYQQNNQIADGTAGKISVAATYSLLPSSPASSPFIGVVTLDPDASLLGASLKSGGGGTLSLESGSVTIGNTAAGSPGELLLSPSLFTRGGFANYSITGLNDLVIGNSNDAQGVAPIVVAPLQQTLMFTENASLQPTGTKLSSFTQLGALPAALRSPANVVFASNVSDVGGAEIGDVTLAKDASVLTDPGASVTLVAQGYNGSVRIYGDIIAPAGTIQVINENQPEGIQFGQDPGYLPGQEILLGPNAVLETPAYAKINTLNPFGYAEGSILPGGTVSLIANKGFIVTDPGSLINVSGTAGTLDIVGAGGVMPTLVAGGAGTVNIAAREGMVLQGALLGQAASINGAPLAGAAAGTLNVTLGYGYDYGVFSELNSSSTAQYPTNPRLLTLVGLNENGQPSEPFTNQLQSGVAFVNVGTLMSGGFQSLSISSSDTIAFSGSLALHAAASLTLDAPAFSAKAGSQTTLSAPYVALGNYENLSDYFSTQNPSPNAQSVLDPVGGTGLLKVSGQLIDLRGISGWSGFATEDYSSSGDIRFVSSANLIQNPPQLNVASNTNFEGALNTSAVVNFEAAQLYPTTATGFAINDSPTVVTGSAAALPTMVSITAPAGSAIPSTPLSAEGSLTIQATEIDQAGVVRAPFGVISLNATSLSGSNGVASTPGEVTLATGSLTSVAADGLTIPFGSTANATQWTYTPTNGVTNVISAPLGKQVSLTGATVSVNSGAQIDLSGGGDLYAYEFIAGQGGSVDVLNPANLPAAYHPAATTVYSYAILPSLNSNFGPLDAQYALGLPATSGQPAASSPAMIGQTITLSGVPGLKAGTYALLPAYYALLPGAFAIQVVQANSGIPVGSAVQQTPGTYLVAGRLGNASAGVLDSLTSSVVVATDAAVRTQAQYTDSYGNAFFYAQGSAASSAASAGQSATPPLPADAGQLLLAATQSLNLNGSLSLASASFTSGVDSSGKPVTQQGRGGDVAITAQDLVVVDSTAGSPAAPGVVELDVHQLNALNSQTLILGASASNSAAGEQLDIGSTQTVELKNSTALAAPEVILAALDNVTVDPGANLSANNSNGGTTPPAGKLLLPGGGALLRVSSGAGDTLVVDPATLPANPTGTVTIGSAANIQAGGSLLLYGSNTTTLAPTAQVSAPGVTLFSSLVSVGDVPSGTPGLTISEQLLGTLKGLTDLTIGSSTTIDLYGPVQLGAANTSTANLSSITFDSSGIAGYGPGDKVFQAGNITLQNSGTAAASFPSNADGTGALQFIATANKQPTSGRITIGSGDKVLNGFSAVDLQAAGAIVLQGDANLTVASSSAVPVNLVSAGVVASAGSSQSISTTGAVTLSASATNSSLAAPAAGLGAKLAIQGTSVMQDGTINLPAGTVTLKATDGDLTLGSGSLTAASGVSRNFTLQSAATAGGLIDLAASNGNVTIASGATVDVSGAAAAQSGAGGDAGTLSVSAPLGTFSFAGATLKGSAPAGQNQGNFTLDVGSGLAGTGFAALTTALSGGGFTGTVDVRSRSDAAISISSGVTAASFQLAADSGSIDVTGAGSVNTSGGTSPGANGGAIALWAGLGLTLEPGAQLIANAGAEGPAGASGAPLASRGGNITLGTASGQIVIGGAGASTTISMVGSGGADTDGTLTLRAPRTPDDANVQINVASGLQINSRQPVVVEGFKTYQANDLGSADAGCGAGGSCDVADLQGVLFSDAATFTAALATLPANLSPLGTPQVRAGIEIDSPVTATSNGDLTLDSSAVVWDLASWNAALGSPVNVTLRAAGNLIFESSLSDGFTNNSKPVAQWTFGEPAGAGIGSASYRLAAGADLTAANPLAVVAQPAPASSLGAPPNSGNVILTPGNLIRSGSGDIAISAGGDVLLGYSFGGYAGNGGLTVAESDPLTAVIYTAGIPSALSPEQAALFTPTNLNRFGGGGPNYPTDGGDISVVAKDDIRSAISAQYITDWLWRRGPTSGTFALNTNTSWWIMFKDFQQGIGTLGGGDLTLSAGRDIVNTSAVIPSTGRLLVAAGGTPAASDLVLTGGGNLHVQAGGNVVSGVYQDDWGNATISAGGAITSGPDSTFGQQFPSQQGNPALPPASTEVYPIFAVGNGTFAVNGAAGVSFVGVTNGTTLPLANANAAAVQNVAGGASFYTYAPDNNPSTLSIASSGGAVTLSNDALNNVGIVALSSNNITYQASATPSIYLATYPSTVNVAAFSSDVNVGDPILALTTVNVVSMTLFPAANGNLNLLAAGSVNNNGQPFTLIMSEANPAAVPTVAMPTLAAAFPGVTTAGLPLTPLHQSDGTPVYLIANSGSIGQSTLNFPKAADIVAGGTIGDLNYVGKNLNPSDVTVIEAGGDISYSTPTEPITNQLLTNNTGITVGGPGYLEVLAGGSINLGDSNGIVTTGSLADSRLSTTGATLVAGASFGTNSGGGLRQPAAQAFINTYLEPNPTTQAPSIYATQLINYMEGLYPATNTNLSYQAALTGFSALTPAQQLPLLAAVLADELSATGLAHTLDGASYTRGYDAINTLFPTQNSSGQAFGYHGDLNMFYSQLKTEQGGDVNVLVPGGSVVVGVPNPPASLNTVKGFTTATGLTVPGAVNLGILVLAQGAIEGFADQSWEVNQSRILTLEGGNIILWASNGNIDAGKGAKSASGAPPPTIQTDANGNSFLDPSNSVSGSGIGQLLTVPGLTPGLVNLIAPKGDVNAGDAGIRVAGNLNIAAVQVIGAGNITVGGTATGVPTSNAGALSGALSGANSLGDASKTALEDLTEDVANSAKYQDLTDSLQPSFITVKMFCLGVECETN